MPKEWTDKDERQYEHVKDSERQQGRSPARSEQIAAATVNKQRSKEGRTKETSGHGKSSRASSSPGRKAGGRSTSRSATRSTSSTSSRTRSARSAGGTGKRTAANRSDKRSR